MAYTAADVKKLRDKTDAPMMECKSALEEAGGDMEKAETILKEKGKMQAGKKAGRATGAGVVAFSPSEDGKTVGAVVVESETDFVSKNENFVSGAKKIADYVRDNGVDDAKMKEFAAELVALFRENILVAQAQQLKSDSPIAFYVHHDNSKGTAIISTGTDAGGEGARKVAIHNTAFPAAVVSKDQLSQELLDKEYQEQYNRAINEGKPANVAENMAKGRVNKEFIKSVVLLEQPFYLDQGKSTEQWLAENYKGLTITGFTYMAVGQNSAE